MSTTIFSLVQERCSLLKNKLTLLYVGLYLVLSKLGEVTYNTQSGPRAMHVVIHIDNIKMFKTVSIPKGWTDDTPENDRQRQPHQTTDKEPTREKVVVTQRIMLPTQGSLIEKEPRKNSWP